MISAISVRIQMHRLVAMTCMKPTRVMFMFTSTSSCNAKFCVELSSYVDLHGLSG